jgi:signal transduction histidine kinase
MRLSSMRLPSWPAAARPPRLPRRTVRLRLTLLYGALFLVSGVVLLAVTYFLVTNKFFGEHVFQTIYGNSPVTVPDAAGPTIAPGRGPDQSPDQLRQFLIPSGVALAIMLAVSITLGWLMAGRVLRPLRTMTATTRQISEKNLHQRLAVTGPDDELKDLADTIDGLLGRLDAAFDTQKDALDAQRRFVANASHELRGPLTLERAAIEVALADPEASAPSLRATFQRVLAVTKQQERLLEALLVLARGQAGLDRWEPFDLAAVTDEVLLARHAQVQRGRLRVDAALDPTLALGDARLAERLVGNLVDNAIGHNLPAGWVQIQTSARAGRAELSVANSGPAVPPAEVDRLLRPFQRLGADRTGHREGHGLGLSIVAAVAAAHHADLRVRARPEGGLDVVVCFPQPDGAAPADAAIQAQAAGQDIGFRNSDVVPRPGGTREPSHRGDPGAERVRQG